jgi:hypothetical protein
MKMMVKKVGENPAVVDLPDEYDTLKDAVGGYIEAVYLDKGVMLWCNEEGKLIGLPHNLSIGGASLEGDLIFTADDGEGGNKDLTDEQVEYIKSLCTTKRTGYQKFIDEFFEGRCDELRFWSYNGVNDDGISVFESVDSLTVIAFLRDIPDKATQERTKNTLLMDMLLGNDAYKFLEYMSKIMFFFHTGVEVDGLHTKG